MAKKEGKKKKTGLYICIILLLAIIAFLIWWFLRTFPITFKYNNGDKEEVLYVRYLRVINEDDVKKDLVRDGYTFAGYFETYFLSGEEIDRIKSDSKNEETICKEGFKLNSDKTKCVAEEEFDFKNTKIKEKKTIEALWSKPVDNSDVKITASANCAIGTNAVTLTAKVSGGAKVKEWNVPSCYTDSKVNANAIKVTRNGNCPNEIGQATIKVTLDNGKTASYVLKYEPKLVVTVYGDSNNALSEDNGRYHYAKYVGTNIKSTFTVQKGRFIYNPSDTEAWFDRSSDTIINAKTACGQSKTVSLTATIN